MKFVTVTCFFLFISIICNAQSNKLELFDSLATYQYKALFIDDKGDTLTSEKVILQSTGQPWSAQKTQILAKYNYFPDSLAYFFRDPIFKKTQYITITREVRTGVVETDSSIWIHPFRENQYKYTEVAPFPKVQKNKLIIGTEWNSEITFIMTGWGLFKGRVKSTYRVTNMVEKEFKKKLLTDCWVIDATGIHNKLGTSTLNILYHKDYGFLEMNYVLYNGSKIQFILEEVTKL